MTEGQYSAEKDLLKLIENPGEIDPKKPQLVNVKASGKTLLSKIPVFSFSKHAKKSQPSVPFNFKTLLTDRKQILRLLFVVTLCVFAFLIVTIFREYTVCLGGNFKKIGTVTKVKTKAKNNHVA